MSTSGALSILRRMRMEISLIRLRISIMACGGLVICGRTSRQRAEVLVPPVLARTVPAAAVPPPVMERQRRRMRERALMDREIRAVLAVQAGPADRGRIQAAFCARIGRAARKAPALQTVPVRRSPPAGQAAFWLPHRALSRRRQRAAALVQ